MKFFGNRLFTLFAAISFAGHIAATPMPTDGKPVKVACIGNSITYGSTLPDREKNAYPSQLQNMLGEGYVVGNFGKPGATLLTHGHRPYIKEPEYRAALDFKPDIAVIHLGINDTDPRDWPDYNDEFIGDYLALIDSFRRVNPDIRILVARLSPIRASHHRFKSGTRDWRNEAQRAIERMAEIAGAELIDFDAPLRDHQHLLPDGLHPDIQGAERLARTVYGGITGRYGGLRMSPVYASGMVLQRDRYLKIHGRADAGSRITLHIGKRSYRTDTDTRGDWSIVLPPLTVGKPFRMSVSDGKTTLHYDDVVAGEVWIASGQSNMAFPLTDAIGASEAIAGSTDRDLRFFDLKPIRYTDNRRWDDPAIDSIDRLCYFKPTAWEKASPQTVGARSAIAYHFGRILRDSLNVPIGIITNAVGGAPIESWIDIATLEQEMPEILLDWRRNDYVQKWAQGRADQNTGTDRPHRHPYEPSYLFAAGMRPLDRYTVAGVIWYQGESNAHNIEIHETLFPLFIDSWRNYFGDSTLPIYYAQLSSLSRPSWPQFRDSQRRLETSRPNIGMVVTSDLGDSLDVHPRHKKPVGERLARIALHDTYGKQEIIAYGPTPKQAESIDGAIWLTMDHADGMRSADHTPLRTFEVAETDGLYYPAVAEIIGNRIKVYNMNVKKPRFVRYGWQPFTRANLVNSAGLPASTFKTAIDNALLFEPEPGIEVGTSAMYAGFVSGRIVTAGGCNFPERPLAPDSPKRFYKGIYCADPADLKWRKIGELPEASAYGASVSTPEGLILIGGATAAAATDRVYRLAIDDDRATLHDLPALPFASDNAYACAIGSKIYVAGGNRNGQPSRELIRLDLDDLAAGWQTLRSIPGNPRTQPVIAAGTDARGEKCLYLWGGFAGKGDRREASLETDGYKFTPSTGKWTALPAPTDENGEEISLGGGAACTLSDGRIAAMGGVNKEIFLSALRNQPADYLQHPIEWYRFNARLLLFDPATEKWRIERTDPAIARAGAAAVAHPEGGCYLMGGELKPRIRTAETLWIRPE